MNIPVIKFEIEGIRTSVGVMLSKYALEMDQQIQDAVDNFCKSDVIERIITETTNTAIKATIESEIGDFFRYGNGRKAIKEAVQNQLNGIYKD
jgi:hypothetical protein